MATVCNVANTYGLRLLRCDGTAIDEFLFPRENQAYSVEATRVYGDVGAIAVELPGNLPARYFEAGNLIEFRRSVDGAALSLWEDTRYILTDRELKFADGKYPWLISGVDLNALLSTRINAHYKTVTLPFNSDKIGPIDNIIKAYVRDNATAAATEYGGSGTGPSFQVAAPDREIVGLTVGIDTSQCRSLTNVGANPDAANYPNRRLDDLIKELCGLSLKPPAGSLATPLWLIGEIRMNVTGMHFDTYTQYARNDRRADVVFSPERGNVSSGSLKYSFGSAVSAVYSGGEIGAGNLTKNVSIYEDSALIQSCFGRREAWRDPKDSQGLTYLQNDAIAGLNESRPKRIASFDIVDTPSSIYGKHFNGGDWVRVLFGGEQFDCRLDAVSLSLKGGKEERRIGLSIDDVVPKTEDYIGTHALANDGQRAVIAALSKIRKIDFDIRRINAQRN